MLLCVYFYEGRLSLLYKKTEQQILQKYIKFRKRKAKKGLKKFVKFRKNRKGSNIFFGYLKYRKNSKNNKFNKILDLERKKTKEQPQEVRKFCKKSPKQQEYFFVIL